MTNLEMLKTATPEQIKKMICEQHDDCYNGCPSFIRERCGVEKNGFLEWLNEEAIAPKDAPKDVPKKWIKLKNEICNEIGSCDNCPPAISKHCDEAFKAMKDWKKPHEPKDAPRGWIKLKSIANFSDNTLYIKASKIVGVGHSLKVDTVGNKAVTAVYTIFAEDNPFLVHDSIDDVIEKIAKA